MALVPTYLARARESERRSSAHYGLCFFVCLCFLDWMTLMFLHRCYCSLCGGLRVTVLQLNTKKRIVYVDKSLEMREE